MHDTLTVGIPVLVILVGILLNRSDVKDLRKEMDRRFEEMGRRFDEIGRRFDSVDAELRYFHGTTSKLDGRVDELSKRIS